MRHVTTDGAVLNSEEIARMHQILESKYSKDLGVEQAFAEIQRQREAQVDFISDTRNLVVLPDDHGLFLEARDTDLQPNLLNSHATSQLCTWGKVPGQYVNRVLEEGDHEHAALLLNRELGRKQNLRMVRTLDGTARAYLSNSFAPFDAWHMLMALQKPLLENAGNGWMLDRISFTESAFHLQITIRSMETRIAVGDAVQFSLKFRTSEVGAGATEVIPAVKTLACTNLALFPEKSLRRIHLGGAREQGVFVARSDDARMARDAATVLAIRDSIEAMVQPGMFQAIVDEINGAAESKLTDKVASTLVLSSKLGLSAGEVKAVYGKMNEGSYEPTVWGLSSALTETARDHADHDRRSELEAFGGELLMASNTWEKLASAQLSDVPKGTLKMLEA